MNRHVTIFGTQNLIDEILKGQISIVSYLICLLNGMLGKHALAPPLSCATYGGVATAAAKACDGIVHDHNCSAIVSNHWYA